MTTKYFALSLNCNDGEIVIDVTKTAVYRYLFLIERLRLTIIEPAKVFVRSLRRHLRAAAAQKKRETVGRANIPEWRWSVVKPWSVECAKR